MTGFSYTKDGFSLQDIQDLQEQANATYLGSFPVGDNIRYVSTTGSDGATGLDQDNAWLTIQKGVNWATAGDIVYVKAGDYGAVNITSTNNGTEIDPIQIIGYGVSPTMTPILNYTYSDDSLELGLDSAVMPLIDGGDRASGGWGIFIRGEDYVTFKNFQVRNYEYGVGLWASTGSVIDNFYMESFGNINAYAGLGVSCKEEGGIDCSNVTVSNMVVLNAAAQAFTISTNDVTIDNCKAYGNDTTTNDAGTDYYFIITGNNNTITNSFAHRKEGLWHTGHGFTIKYNGTGNLIKDCLIENVNGAFVFRHSGVFGNTFENITATDESLGAEGYGLTFRDGCHDNTVINYNSSGLRHPITFREVSDPVEDGDNTSSGYNNTVTGGTSENVFNAFIIYFAATGAGNAVSLNNTFTDMTFDGSLNTQSWIASAQPPSGNEFVDCTFIDIETYIGWGGSTDGDTVYTNPTQIDCGFTLP